MSQLQNNAHAIKAGNSRYGPSTPVVIIGAGPVGLAAAAHLTEYNLPFVIVEAGAQAGHSVRDWGHVQLFSPWRYSLDKAAVRLLEPTGWQAPDPEAYPTGHALVERYLAPLAAHPAIAPHLRLNRRVAAITRVGRDKLSNAGREQSPFVLYIVAADGSEEVLHAGAVIDASGTYGTPNPLGAHGIPALGERAAAAQIFYGIPDALGTQRERYAGKRVLVAGSGHSAFNALLDLAALAEQAPGTRITWVVRRTAEGMAQAYGGGANDALPARGELGRRLQALVATGVVQLINAWRSDRVEQTAAGLVVYAGERSLAPVDEIIVTTGLRPNLAMLSELRLGLDPAVEAPVALAPLIDPNLHSCGTVRPHGVNELSHPEPNVFIVGMKSYGRAPTFLLLTGYEQVRSVTAALAGDWEAARRVELELPETGVCSGPVAAGGAVASGCCGAEEAPAALIALEPVAVTASCCEPTVQATCCEPEAKADCCGTTAVETITAGSTLTLVAGTGSSCGCR
ncbi:MAG: NAD(P)-binding domain-containing protein [Oscillochloris sp.]|nr:NAD(P)-binding domain-containing protein [Oscillochloris sp.]